MTDSLLTHLITAETIEIALKKISERIQNEGNKPYVSVERQLEILKGLSEFDFGCFLLQNQGLNGYWTHHMLTHPWFGSRTLSPIEDFLLNRAPTVLATQERFKIFLNENQKSVKNNAKLASIPSGMLGELLYLDYSNIDNIELFAIDFDADTLNDAKSLSDHKQLTPFTQFIQQDAWKIDLQNTFDLISSNGLNFYESDDEKVTALYQVFYNALKPGGKLVTSFLTPPNEWNMSVINQEDLLLQKIIFVDIIQVRWQQCHRSTETTREQLQKAGFKDVQFIFDKAKLMPTVIAIK